MAVCPGCSAQVSPAQRFCGSCGRPLPASSQAGTVAMTAAAPSRASRTSTTDPERFPPGQVLAQRYRVVSRIGRGGMGEVYRAYDLILEQDVALKFLPHALTTSPAALDRFRNEVRLARQVSHPNICRVYDIGEIEDAPFLTMEYVDGEDLASLLRRIGRLPADKALDISRRLCAGLAAAHEKGVLHRDLKPANIMIDGRGEVLITDFGLAAMAGTVDETAARQGTPAYQAPEQLAGREVTARSDIYALGLVLYEVFTGKRAFEAASIEELARLQSESTPTPVTSLARDADPAIERAILRCLAPDPRRRPASARSVAAALPGADPLAAALAAGETPSPEMVAQAGETEGPHLGFAIAMLALALASLVGLAITGGGTRFPDKTPFDNSPEALATIARETVNRVGYTARPADTAFGFTVSKGYLDYAPSHYSWDRIWAQLAAARPAPVTFWYRESPEALDPAPGLMVTAGNPGFALPGMLRVRLDMQGRLLAFEARPPEQASAAPAGPPDWKPFFDAARLDPAHFQPASPEVTPSMASDTLAAWTGSWPEAPNVPIRIEAAAWHGKPVSFRIVEPWMEPAGMTHVSTWSGYWILIAYVMLFPAAIVLARRNLKLNRGDRTGALRLGAAFFILLTAADILTFHYFPSTEMALQFFDNEAIDLVQSAFFAVVYLAVEPYVRRRCPTVLISWARLFQNGPRDSRVGADALAGAAIGLAVALLHAFRYMADISYGHRLGDFISVSHLLFSTRHFFGGVLGESWNSVFIAVVTMAVFILAHLLTRRDWIAAAAVAVVFTFLFAPGVPLPVLDVPVAFIAYATSMFVLLRFGLLGSSAMLIVFTWTMQLVPLTLDTSRWYFGYSLAALLLTAALVLWAFRTALAGRKLLRDDSLA